MTSSLRYQFLGASLSTFGMTYMRSPAIDVNTTRGPFSMFGLCASSQLAYIVKMTLASNCQPASKYIQKIPKNILTFINKLSKPFESCPAFNKLHSATFWDSICDVWAFCRDPSTHRRSCSTHSRGGFCKPAKVAGCRLRWNDDMQTSCSEQGFCGFVGRFWRRFWRRFWTVAARLTCFRCNWIQPDHHAFPLHVATIEPLLRALNVLRSGHNIQNERFWFHFFFHTRGCPIGAQNSRKIQEYTGTIVSRSK